MEYSSDPRGAYVLGRVGARVLYARLEGTIGAELAQRFVARLAGCVGEAQGLHYFADTADVGCYDLAAAKLVIEAALSHRQRFERIVARPWRGPVTQKASEFADAFGSCEYVASAAEFEARLLAAAPSALAEIAVARAASTRGAARLRPSPDGGGPGPYAYVFDLSNFECGRFVATRLEHVSRRPGGCWVCLAGNDDQALNMARRAALDEWARPTSRRPEEFTVEFVELSGSNEQAAVARR